MKKIQLTNTDQHTCVDDQDYLYLNQWLWRLDSSGYVSRNARIDGVFRTYLMHRIILNLDHGDIRKGDHEDHDTLNNQRYNLRIATHAQNQYNRVVSGKTKTSQFKGVCRKQDSVLWYAQIKYLGTVYYLGYFVNEVDAAKVYNAKALELFGEFARLNTFEELT